MPRQPRYELQYAIQRGNNRQPTFFAEEDYPCYTERYVLIDYRYIELNPVRAGVVNDPAEYRWSRYGRNAWGKSDLCVKEHFSVQLSYPEPYGANLQQT